MTLKTMAELNANEPHLRDLEITVDGLNVVDIQFAGPGVWVPRFTVQISGDMGLDATTGQRRAYLSAAEYLRSALLNNGTGDGSKPHAFVPHANISREDEPGDQEAAVDTAESAIAGLLKAYSEPVINPEGEGPVENFEWFGKSLHIVVRTVDFDLTEKRILSAEAFDKLQAAIDAPADPAPELVKLMQGERHFTTRVENGGEPLDTEETELAVSNITKSFDGVLHASVVLEGSFVAPNQVYWIPADRIDEFPSLEAIRTGTVLTCIANHADWVEYLVQIPSLETAAPEIKPDVRATTVLIDGVQHKRFEREDNGVRNVFWVPETMDVVIDQEHDIDDNLLMVIIAEDDNGNLEWRVTGRK